MLIASTRERARGSAVWRHITLSRSSMVLDQIEEIAVFDGDLERVMDDITKIVSGLTIERDKLRAQNKWLVETVIPGAILVAFVLGILIVAH